VPFHQHTLDNGLDVIGETSKSARSMALGFFVRTGARDEAPGIAGVSHFLEHMVFKGTPRRSALQVNQDFDRMGAQYNAFTSEENTVFYAGILPEYMPQALDLLADILRPSLRAQDFETEKEVIIEEISMYDDQPTWVAYDRARQLYFGNHPLGNSVLGTAESIRALNRDQMEAYFRRRYVPANMTLVAAGNFDWNAFLSLVDKQCGRWDDGASPREGVYAARGPELFAIATKESVTQEHVIMMSPGPPVDSEMIYAANILAMILGDDTGSRLYWALVDRGLVDTADANFHEHQGTGVFFTSFSCAPEKAQENLGIVRGLLQQLQKEGVASEEVEQAKNKVMSRMVRGSERPLGRMQAIGSLWTYLHTYRTVDEELSHYEAVTVDSIRAVLEKYPPTKVATLALGPLTDLRASTTKAAAAHPA
jgi:predicted Zn-dependent peptidase